MKLAYLEDCPESYYGPKKTEPLDEYDVKRLKELGVEEAYYWYYTGSYDGSGYIVFRIGDKWQCHDMGHCSCYGPFEGMNKGRKYDSPRQILEEATNDYRSYVVQLIELAEKSA